MTGSDLVMYEEEFRKIDAELQKLHQQSNAKVVFLVDKNGQLIASAGENDIDIRRLLLSPPVI
jgi:C4-dicarboxylate-specific signal transduction histidine kinase